MRRSMGQRTVVFFCFKRHFQREKLEAARGDRKTQPRINRLRNAKRACHFRTEFPAHPFGRMHLISDLLLLVKNIVQGRTM